MPTQAMTNTVARTLRSLRRSPGFAAIATVSFGAALGLSTTMFALVDAIHFPVAAFRDPDRLFAVGMSLRLGRGPTPDEFTQALAAIPDVERVAAVERVAVTAVIGDQVESINASFVDRSYFDVLGVRPRLGSIPTADDVQRGDAAVVSDGLWIRRFGNRRTLGGAKMAIGDHEYVVAGVLPPGTSSSGEFADVWLPRGAQVANFLSAVVLVRAGVTRDRLHPLVRTIVQQLAAAYVGPRGGAPYVYVASLRPQAFENDLGSILVAAALAMLFSACANVAALMLARGAVRRRDYALRLALGAPRTALAREVIAEVAMLALAGTLVGGVIARWGAGVLAGAMPEQLAGLGLRPPDWNIRVLVLNALAMIVCVAAAGGYPAWRASRVDPADPLKESSGSATSRVPTRFRWLVIGEMAIAMILVLDATLMRKSMNRVDDSSSGYAAHGVLDFRVAFTARRDSLSTTERGRYLAAVIPRMRALPGVRSVGSRSELRCPGNVIVTEHALQERDFSFLYGRPCLAVGPEFFRTIGLPILEGREFTEGDLLEGGAVILDQKTAKRLFPHESAVGRRVKFGLPRESRPWLPVVGVTDNRNVFFQFFPELGADAGVAVYVARYDSSARGLHVLLRPERSASHVAFAAGRVLTDLLPPAPWSSWSVGAFDPTYESYRGGIRFVFLVLASVGLLSLALAGTGLFSVVSYVANQRRREFAIRVALGAPGESVARLVMRSAFELGIGGAAIGAIAGMVLAFPLWIWLYGIFPVDAEALLLAEAILLGVTAAASAGPALVASRTNPAELLRAT